MQAFNEAWEIVSDRFIREKYDEAIGDKKSESNAFDETSQIEDEDDAIKDYFEKDWNLLFISIDLTNLFPILDAHLQFASLHLL